MSRPEYPVPAQTDNHLTPYGADPESVDDAGHAAKARILHRIELLAEQPEVHVQRYVAGELKIQRVVRQKTVQIPVTLQEEILEISYHPARSTDFTAQSPAHRSTPSIRINGETIYLQDNQTLDISLYREKAQVSKTAYVVEEVEIGKLTNTLQHQLSITLQHEALDINQTTLPEPPDQRGTT